MMRRVLAIGLVCAIGALLIFTVSNYLLPFGTFPQRKFENFENQSVAQVYLENAPIAGAGGAGSANVVTSIVWDYRGYDTLGEATILFTAVCGVAMLFRAAKEED
jgi:multisubunit Na+/H+ antiporter MnhB subunit